jgi:hypothetical protein
VGTYDDDLASEGAFEALVQMVGVPSYHVDVAEDEHESDDHTQNY